MTDRESGRTSSPFTIGPSRPERSMVEKRERPDAPLTRPASLSHDAPPPPLDRQGIGRFSPSCYRFRSVPRGLTFPGVRPPLRYQCVDMRFNDEPFPGLRPGRRNFVEGTLAATRSYGWGQRARPARWSGPRRWLGFGK